MAERFQCRMCGNCCRNTRRRTGDKELPSPLPRVFLAVTPSRKTIGLFEWEVLALQKRAKQLSSDFSATPNTMFWDEIGKTPTATQWNLDHDNCPFLSKKNLCFVDEQKPLVCQAYPLMAFGILNTNRSRPKRLELADCLNANPLPFEEGKIVTEHSIVFHELFRIHGSTFLGMLRLDSSSKMHGEIVRNYEEKLDTSSIHK